MVVEVTNIGDNYTCKPNLTIKQKVIDTGLLLLDWEATEKQWGKVRITHVVLGKNWRQQKEFMFQLKIYVQI